MLLDITWEAGMGRRISYWFGAGAERSYGLPQGSDFTRSTLLDSADELRDALSNFYDGIENHLRDWAPRYNRSLSYTTNMGRQIIVQTVLFLIRTKHSISQDDLEYAIDSFFTEDDMKHLEEEFKLKVLSNQEKSEGTETKKPNIDSESLKEVLDLIIYPSKITDELPHHMLLRAIAEKLISYGVIEKYFHTIINPKNYGPVKYWKLINHYWQSYFAVTIPLCEYLKSHDNKSLECFQFDYTKELKIEKSEKNYTIFLDNLKEISKILWSDNTLEYFKADAGHYYNQPMLRNAIGIITTNYTPIINMIDPKKVAYTNGRLNLFEYPFELTIHDFSEDTTTPSHNMYFPFILGTSSIKPVIDAVQIQQIHKMHEILEKSDTLIIIGYAINVDDNHLNSFIRNFLMNNEEKNTNDVIYCSYCPEDKEFDKIKEKMEILKLLRIYGADGEINQNFERLKIVRNTGCAKTLFNDLSEVLSTGRKNS